jgi:hypothetical protein
MANSLASKLSPTSTTSDLRVRIARSNRAPGLLIADNTAFLALQQIFQPDWDTPRAALLW